MNACRSEGSPLTHMGLAGREEAMVTECPPHATFWRENNSEKERLKKDLCFSVPAAPPLMPPPCAGLYRSLYCGLSSPRGPGSSLPNPTVRASSSFLLSTYLIESSSASLCTSLIQSCFSLFPQTRPLISTPSPKQAILTALLNVTVCP